MPFFKNTTLDLRLDLFIGLILKHNQLLLGLRLCKVVGYLVIIVPETFARTSVYEMIPLPTSPPVAMFYDSQTNLELRRLKSKELVLSGKIFTEVLYLHRLWGLCDQRRVFPARPLSASRQAEEALSGGQRAAHLRSFLRCWWHCVRQRCCVHRTGWQSFPPQTGTCVIFSASQNLSVSHLWDYCFYLTFNSFFWVIF